MEVTKHAIGCPMSLPIRLDETMKHTIQHKPNFALILLMCEIKHKNNYLLSRVHLYTDIIIKVILRYEIINFKSFFKQI